MEIERGRYMHVATKPIYHLLSHSKDQNQQRIELVLSTADIKIDGGRPWDICVLNDKFFKRVLVDGSMGLGESYVDGWWECRQIDELFRRIYDAGLETRFITWKDGLKAIHCRLFNQQKFSRSFRIGKHHYDIGNDLYKCMLDKRMVYSCGYWRHAKNLDEAQEAKLDLICRKLDLKPGMKVLDIGCGWGSAAKFIAKRYDAEVVGITVSQEQVNYANEACKGLPIEILLKDYRSLTGEFDRVISIGMIEHVGYKNYANFMHIARQVLKKDGLFLLQSIGGESSVISNDRWLEKYIFPNSMLPSIKQIFAATEGNFVIEDCHNFGADYDQTLMSWFENFQCNWDQLQDKYGDRFYRMWKYYLLSCAGIFRARAINLWQIVLSPSGVPGGYCGPRNEY